MKKNLVYGLIFILIVAAGSFFFYIYYQETYAKFDQDKIIVTQDNEYWTSEDVTVTVKYTDINVNVKSYSFDGGKTWQTSNKYVVKENQLLDIVIKSDKNKKSRPVNYRINNIDKEEPVIIAEEKVFVAIGSIVDIASLYDVSDSISGIKGHVQITSKELDAETLGVYTVDIYAEDRALNSTIKRISIEVVEANDTRLVKETGPVVVTGLSVATPRISLVKGTQTVVFPIIKPSNATNKKVTYSSDNESVAIVDSNGKISAISAGIAFIKVTTEDGGKSSEVKVTVTNNKVEVTSITLDRKADNVTTETKMIVLTPNLLPENATDQSIVWSSTKPQVASVSNGIVTIKTEGEATITATSSNGKVATYQITVRDQYTFTEKETTTVTGEIMGYSLKIYKNGHDITNKVTRITAPFTVGNEKGSKTELPISIEQHKMIKDSITIWTDASHTVYR